MSIVNYINELTKNIAQQLLNSTKEFNRSTSLNNALKTHLYSNKKYTFDKQMRRNYPCTENFENTHSNRDHSQIKGKSFSFQKCN